MKRRILLSILFFTILIVVPVTLFYSYSACGYVVREVPGKEMPDSIGSQINYRFYSYYPVKESEPNGDIFTAIGPLVSGIEIHGRVSCRDCSDYFFLNLDQGSCIEINLASNKSGKMHWVLYKSDKPEDVVAWGNRSEGSVSGSYCAEAGTYFINVYTWSEGGNYRLTVSGNISCRKRLR